MFKEDIDIYNEVLRRKEVKVHRRFDGSTCESRETYFKRRCSSVTGH